MEIILIATLLLVSCFQSYAFLSASNSKSLNPINRSRFNKKLFTVIEITSAIEFDNLITKQTDMNNVKVVDFKKSKCTPCIKVQPHYLELSNKYDNKVEFYSVDADECTEGRAIMKVQGIRSVPTFHIYKGGERTESIQGTHIDEVEEAIENELRIINRTS